MAHQVELLDLCHQGCLDFFELGNQRFTTHGGTVEGVDLGHINFGALVFQSGRDLVPVVDTRNGIEAKYPEPA